jgi:hypothetical protein
MNTRVMTNHNKLYSIYLLLQRKLKNMHKDTKYAKMQANKNFMHDMKELETGNKMTKIIMLHVVLNKLKIIKKKNTFHTFPK